MCRIDIRMNVESDLPFTIEKTDDGQTTALSLTYGEVLEIEKYLSGRRARYEAWARENNVRLW